MLGNLWNLKIQILPVVIALIICELPALTRWFKKIPYIPIYFSVFPFNILNRDLSIYLGEDYFYGEDLNLTEDKIEAQRKHINNISTISLALFVFFTPSLGGFLSAFFLPADSLPGFCIIFIVYKLIGMTEAVIDFDKQPVANVKTMMSFILIYLIYFGIFILVFNTTYFWAEPFVLKGDWIGLIKAIPTLLLYFILSVFVMGPLGRLFSSTITDRKLRDKIK